MYQIQYHPEPEYLRVDLTGDLAAPERRVAAWREIIQHCRDGGVTHLLVVQDSPGNGTPANAYHSSAGIAELGLGGIRIAFVDIDPENYEVNKFGELVAENRGAQARVFVEEGPAVDWLLERHTP